MSTSEDERPEEVFVLRADAGQRARGAGALNPNGDEPAPSANTPPEPRLQLIDLAAFLTEHEDEPEPLIGEADDTILPAAGVLLMYGDGGAGKTTLTLDAIAHMAAGETWLNIPLPRPLRILIVENEGPRTEFRRSLANKVNSWQGEPWSRQITILKEPWGRLDLRDSHHRAELAQGIGLSDTDLVCLGPLATLGTIGGGTPDEINAFHQLLDNVREQASRPFALWMLHHENKSGDVSGAWERYPDTLLHVQSQGNGRTGLHWRKVRWSSRLHGTSSNLTWTDGKSFQLEERHDRDLHAETLAWLTNHPGYHSFSEIVNGIEANKDKIRAVLDTLTETGRLQHATGRAAGLKADGSYRHSNSKCWQSVSNTGSEGASLFEPVPQIYPIVKSTGSPARPYRESR